MAEHTPGPWELWTGCSWRRFGSSTTGETVCEPTVHPRDRHPDLLFRNGGQDGPDARLIAAAPDLLAALKTLLATYESGASSGDWGFWDWEKDPEVIAARDAIAKAEGHTYA